MTPLVSVIMPVYNAEPYLASSLQSVIAQDYHHWELLVIDDGSTDGSHAVIKRFTDPRIRYFYQKKRGVSSARNEGLKRCKGEFLCFLDADDALPVQSISKRVSVFMASSEVTVVDGRVEVLDGHMRKIIKTWQPSVRGRVTSSLLSLKSDCFFALTWMVRVIPGAQYSFDEDMTHAEDLLFLTNASLTGNYDYVNSPVYQYRLTPGSAMRQIDGLGKGYWQYYHKVCELYPGRMSRRIKWLLFWKIRKIMFLSYLAEGRVASALQYLVMGRTH